MASGVGQESAMNLKSTVIGSTLLVVLLTAGAAQSLSGSNTVTSDDIVDRTIVANDIQCDESDSGTENSNLHWSWPAPPTSRP